MLKAPAMILDAKGTSNLHYIGGGGGMRKFAGFAKSLFGLDCSYGLATATDLRGVHCFEHPTGAQEVILRRLRLLSLYSCAPDTLNNLFFFSFGNGLKPGSGCSKAG